jgi:hypothetical protein
MNTNSDYLDSSSSTPESLTEPVTSREALMGITNVQPPEPCWTKTPPVTGVYWFQFMDARPDICWVHQGSVWFAPQYGSDHNTVSYYAELGDFFGPLPYPTRA